MSQKVSCVYSVEPWDICGYSGVGNDLLRDAVVPWLDLAVEYWSGDIKGSHGKLDDTTKTEE
jgi:hypothetical protein